MALDKQKILNELGNVVNQLQSADCGCMGKLFSNSNQSNQNGNFQNVPMVRPVHDGYMRGCCHGHGCGHGCHGYNAPGAGEPFSDNRNCMGFCNPPKVYTDTYNYLNHNLMQPVVKEVYDDLKSISPANTMMNSPTAAQMGLSQVPLLSGTVSGTIGDQMGNMAQNQMPGGVMGNQNAMSNHHHGPNVYFGNPNMGHRNNTMQMGNLNSQQQMAQPTAGLGPNIVNMMMGDTAAKRGGSIPNQGDTQGGIIGNNVPQSPEMGLMSNTRGDLGQEQYIGDTPGNNPVQYNNTRMSNMGQGNPGAGAPMQNPSSQFISQPNTYAGANANMQGNTMNDNMSQMNPASLPKRTLSASAAEPQLNPRNPYGQHSAGMAKFNEMFPGVIQGGDLGFDPMAIAIQMNPANQKRAAMETMQKMMMSNGVNRVNASSLQPVINATNTTVANMPQCNQPLMNQAPSQQIVVPTSTQQQIPRANAAAVSVQNNQVPPQQVYTAVTGTPTMNQQQVPQQEIHTQQQQYQQQYQGQNQQPQHQMVDPKKGAVVGSILPTVYEGLADSNAKQEGLPQNQSTAPPISHQMIKEPIFPADTLRKPPTHMNLKPQIYYQYNTLGQPVEMLSADIYRSPEPNLPQTLSPQSISMNDQGRYSNVKATVSKTSLMENRPVGRTPSRGQLQQIYNQYKGSQSYTQQNIRPPDNGSSYSEGHLNVHQSNAVRHAPIERVGGDTTANNVMNNPANTTELRPGQVGDAPAANKPLADAEKAPVNQSKVRNGLQDQIYTSYSTSAAWSFHGATPAPFSTAYRFRNKV